MSDAPVDRGAFGAPVRIMHLTASPFFGGPERQMLGLGKHLSERFESTFVSFAERGLARPFLDQAGRAGFAGVELRNNFPNVRAAIRELETLLRERDPALLVGHGYKSNVLGRLAAQRVGTPMISVSRGWTRATWKVRAYEVLDRVALRTMRAVVCVSRGQADKVRRAGVRHERIFVIHNAIDAARFAERDRAGRERLQRLFSRPRDLFVAAVGRLSPEKGFELFVEAAGVVRKQQPNTGFVIFGDGPLRPALMARIRDGDLGDHVVLAGHRTDLDSLLPSVDVVVQSSRMEGLPNVLLEASAARVPVVATAVGGTPEVVVDGESGFLVMPGDANALAEKTAQLLADASLRTTMGAVGRALVCEQFTFRAQAAKYEKLFSAMI